MKIQVQNLVRELVERRLWPVAVLLAVALAAVPVLLGRPADDAAAPAVPAPPATQADTAVEKAEVSVDTAVPAIRERAGAVRNPFAAPKSKRAKKEQAAAPAAPSTAASGSDATPAPSTSTTSTGSGSSGASSDSGSGSTSSGSGSGSTGSGSTPTPKPTPKKTAPKATTTAPKADDAKDTYHVDLQFGVNGAQPKTIDDVARLSPLPSLTDPFFVFLGVIETKAHEKRAVFLVSSDATPNGEGSCHPTKTDCESVELAVGQTAFFDYVAPDGTATQYQLQLEKIRRTEVRAEATAAAAVARHSIAGAELLRDAAVRGAAAGARAYRYVPAVGLLVRAKRRHVSARAAAAGTLVPGIALVSRKHQPGLPVWHSPKP
jgi:hypothetical protein